MSRRRKSGDDHENHERWLVSYADFITLLFAFFVVMYSLSSVNEGKYRVLSDSLVSAFRTGAIHDSDQQVAMPGTTVDGPPSIIQRSPPAIIERPPTSAATGAQRADQVRKMNDMAEHIRRVLEPLTRSGQVSVSEGAHGITVEINASVLFAAGEAALGISALAPLRAVAEVLSGANFPVTIEGHTDDIPINTFRFPSNWELSSARASSVVRLFVDAGVAADRLTASGYSDQRPIADNATEEGRARNRRVTILIESMFVEPPTPAAPGYIRPSDPIRSILPAENNASF